MSNRLSDAMNKLNVDSARNSMARNSAVAASKRQSGLDSSTINAMFPDSASAIATEKAKYTQQTGNPPPSNRNSAAVDNRNSLAAPTISAPTDAGDLNGQNPVSPWGNNDPTRPKSSSGQPPMGQFVQPPPSAGLRSPRPQLPGSSQIQNTTISTADKSASDLPMLSPYGASGNWASMVNTPMAPNFQQSGNQAEMLANATAMKLAALSTVNNRFALDDARRYRRKGANEGQNPLSPNAPGLGLPGTNVVMVNEHGQLLTPEQMLAIQSQQTLGLAAHRSRPNSPGIAMQGGFGAIPFATTHNNGFLSAYDGSSPLINNGLGGTVSLSQLGLGNHHEGYLSDHSDMVRGRSPRGRRGSSKPPEDPTDPTLLQDIPSWLRSLRLHKYTDNLKDLKWTELVELDDKQLEDRGVNALGARRKMLKVFEQVKGMNATTPLDVMANMIPDAKADGKLA